MKKNDGGTKKTASVPMLCIAIALSACTSMSDESADTFSSPIESYLGTGLFLDFRVNGSDPDEQRRQREEVIATCMREQGFEYVPVDFSQAVFSEVEPGIEWGSDAYIEKYGFGISTLHFEQTQVGPELLGNSYAENGNEVRKKDANIDIYEAMDAATQTAYDKALYGNQTPIEFDSTMTDDEVDTQFEDVGNATPGGCEGKAWGTSSFEGFRDEFGAEMDALEGDTAKDPLILKFLDDLKACAAEDGFAIPDDYPIMNNYLKSELASLGPGPFDPVWADTTREEIEAMSDEQLDELFKPPELSDEAKAKLAEFQRDEIALYKKTIECKGDPDSYWDLYSEVRVEYEKKFVETNKARLDDFKANQG